MFKHYYELTKPGIIKGNLIYAAAGFFFASSGDINLKLLVWLLGGTSLVIASACVFNNFIDRDIDKKMQRTQKRALASGDIPLSIALIYGLILGVIGFTILGSYTNSTTVLVGLIGFVNYIVFYGAAKRSGEYGTLVGSISGATPIVAGYTAVTGRIDEAAVILFAILVFWQMPHFYSIAIYRLSDYRAAKIPVLPAVKGIEKTKLQILFYIAAFLITASLLTILGYTGIFYLLATLTVGFFWIRLALIGFTAKDNTVWAKKMFRFSLIVTIVFAIAIAVSPSLP